MKYCPDCETRLQPGNDFCACGWGMPKKSGSKHGKNRSVSSEAERKGLCEYQHKGKDCPAIAGHTSSIKGGGKWLCSRHFMGSAEDGEEIIDDYEKNGLPERKNTNGFRW